MKTTITRFLMCCILFAVSFVTSFAADKLILIGDAAPDGWALNNSVAMLNQGNDVWKVTVQLKADEGFKFLTDTDFGSFQYRAGDSDVMLSDGVAATLYDSGENANDSKFQVAEAGNYVITCDLNAGTITVKKADYQDNEIVYAALWLVGDATENGWDLGQPVVLAQDASNPMVYTATADLKEGELQVVVNKFTSYNSDVYVSDATDATKAIRVNKDSEKNNWKITEAGKYDVKLNVLDNTMSIIKNVPSAISSVNANGEQAPVEYYTLEGMRVNQQVKGICIMRQGNKVVKVSNK